VLKFTNLRFHGNRGRSKQTFPAPQTQSRPKGKAAFILNEHRLRVIYTSETRTSGAFTVTHRTSKHS